MLYGFSLVDKVMIDLVCLQYAPHSKDLDEAIALLSSVSKSCVTKCSGLNTQLVLVSRHDCSQAYI